MTEITLPIQLQIELENSWAFGLESDPVTGDPAKPGTRYFLALKSEIERRLIADMSELGSPSVRGTTALKSKS